MPAFLHSAMLAEVRLRNSLIDSTEISIDLYLSSCLGLIDNSPGRVDLLHCLRVFFRGIFEDLLYLLYLDFFFRGNRRHLLAWANRNAFYYVLDRQTGQFLLARPFARQTWAAGIDSAGRPQARPSARPTSAGTLVYPGVSGATNWWSPSFSPRTGLLYVPVLEEGSTFFSEPVRYARGEAFAGSGGHMSGDVQTAVRALDPLTGVMRWEHRFKPRMEWHRTGGILSVAGDLVFIGDETVFYALDARTGAELWRFNTGGKISAAPVTYVANGKQYVVIAAGRSFMAFGIGTAAPGAGSASAGGAGSSR